MQANEFEKKVKLSVEELKLHPSGKVWQKVEETIRERKKRRRIVFFLLFALIGLIGAGYGIYNYDNKTSSNIKTNTTEAKNNNNSNNQTVQPDKKTNSNTVNNTTNSTQDNTQNNNVVKSNQSIQPKPVNRRAARKNTDENASIDVTNTAPDKMKKNENEVVKNDVKTEADTKIETIAADKTKVEKPVEEKKAEVNEVNNVVANNQTDSTAVAVINNNKPEEQSKAPEKAAEKKKDIASDKKKWRWGFSFSPGVSSLSENLFSFEKSSYAMADNLNAGSPGAPSSPVSPGYNEPSSSKTGVAFKLGVTLQTNISKRGTFSTGLLYGYHSDRIRIGMMNNATALQNYNQTYVSPYYRGGPPKNYTDNYHFVELPIMYSLRLGKNEKRFLSLDMGPSISYLFKTNALVYDPSLGGFYYHDKSMINKLHLGFNTGASFHLTDRKGKEWTLGPRFSFDTKKAFKTPYEERKYFIYAGINIGLTLPSKKSK